MWGIASAYSPTGNAADGAATPAYNVAVGFYLIFWGIVVFLLLAGSTRTNLVFVFVFFTLDIRIFLLVGAFFKVADGKDVLAGHLQKVCGQRRGIINVRPVDRSFSRRGLGCSICLSLSCWRSWRLKFLSLLEISLHFGRGGAEENKTRNELV